MWALRQFQPVEINRQKGTSIGILEIGIARIAYKSYKLNAYGSVQSMRAITYFPYENLYLLGSAGGH